MNRENVAETIKQKTISLGASLVGIADSRAVLNTPSHQRHAGIQRRFKVGSFIVMALEHPASNPLLDWWNGRGGTPGNRQMQHIGQFLQSWLKKELDVVSRILPYQVEKGGIFLKEAAVMAGLGVIGRNNLLITPRYGAGVRLRAMFLQQDFLADKPVDFAPCDDCSAPCQAACPQNAFQDGGYQRNRCSVQMQKNESRRKKITLGKKERSVVQYCRACEWACPVSGC